MDLSDVHQAFGEHVIANMESNHPPEEHDVVRDPDGPNEAAFEIHGRLPDSRHLHGLRGGPREARLVELADGCRIVPRGLVHLSAIPSVTRLTTNSRDEGGNHQAVGVSLADRDAGSTLMKRSPPWATLTGE